MNSTDPCDVVLVHTVCAKRYLEMRWSEDSIPFQYGVSHGEVEQAEAEEEVKAELDIYFAKKQASLRGKQLPVARLLTSNLPAESGFPDGRDQASDGKGPRKIRPAPLIARSIA